MGLYRMNKYGLHCLIGEEKQIDSSMHEHAFNSLVEMCKLMNLALDLDTLLNTIIQMTPDTLESDEASINLLTENKEEIIFYYTTSDKDDRLQKIHLKYGEGIVGSVIREGTSVIVNDVYKDSRFCERVDKTIGFKTRNILCVPIKIENKITGALEILNKRNHKDFDSFDSRICEAIASQAGVAIERARLIEKYLKSARLAAIGETIAGLAHCVKNLLNGFKAGEYLVNRAIEGQDMPMVSKGWNMVEKNINRISTLVLDMLTYVKDREPEYSEVDLNNLIEEARELLRIQADKVGVEIETKIDKNLNKVILDPKGIFRCLVNLIGNAVDACSEKGGYVSIESRPESDDYFEIEVSDTGCGMDKDTLEVLFTKFFSTKGSKGTGLGLPVVHKIIKEHQGTINVRSEPGQGTTFSMRLPRQQPSVKFMD
jgi:signal transduction histidine kinase